MSDDGEKKKKWTKKKIIVITAITGFGVFLTLLIISLSITNGAGYKLNLNETYSNNERGISFALEGDWIVKKNVQVNNQTEIIVEYLSLESRSIISVSATNTDKTSVESEVESHKERVIALGGGDENIVWTSEELAKIDNFDARRLTYFTAGRNNATGDEGIQFLFLWNTTRYLIDFSSSPDSFDSNKYYFDRMISTFRITHEKPGVQVLGGSVYDTPDDTKPVQIVFRDISSGSNYTAKVDSSTSYGYYQINLPGVPRSYSVEIYWQASYNGTTGHCYAGNFSYSPLREVSTYSEDFRCEHWRAILRILKNTFFFRFIYAP